MEKRYQKCVIFGGAGYIGSFFANHLLKNNLADEIYLADISKSKLPIWPKLVKQAFSDGRVKLVMCDVRQPIVSPDLPDDCDLICNFAAIHREPGHEPHEYYETNLYGAENVCNWADRVHCQQMIFTSSIAPYGYSGKTMDEDSLTVPATAYGASKLAAEKMHIGWQKQDQTRRYLSIVRPGVIYGPGEDGNVPRMIHAIKKNYFFYVGNKNVTKAGGYVKELVNAMLWVANNQINKKQTIALYNFSMPNPPTIKEYAETICKVLNKKPRIFSVPFPLLLSLSYVIESVARPLGIKHPFNPVRIRKLTFSNDIFPKYLHDQEYVYQYTLEQSLIDWKNDHPETWNMKTRNQAKPSKQVDVAEFPISLIHRK